MLFLVKSCSEDFRLMTYQASSKSERADMTPHQEDSTSVVHIAYRSNKKRPSIKHINCQHVTFYLSLKAI